MSPEMLSIIGVGVALAVLIFGLFGWLRSDIAKTDDRIQREMALFRQEIRQELRDTIRASEQRIIAALANHHHPEQSSPPVFTQPV